MHKPLITWGSQVMRLYSVSYTITLVTVGVVFY